MRRLSQFWLWWRGFGDDDSDYPDEGHMERAGLIILVVAYGMLGVAIVAAVGLALVMLRIIR